MDKDNAYSRLTWEGPTDAATWSERVVIRSATPEELAGLSPCVRWGYDRGLPLVKSIEYGTIALLNGDPDPDVEVVLQQDTKH